MPMHRIFYPINALSVEDKKQLAERITELYVSGKCEGLTVPPFYVQVIFTPIDKDSLFVGGKVTDKCVRIHMYHREDQLKTKESKKKFLEMYEMVLAPFIKERGLDWEVSGEFCPPHMLRMNGVPQPLPGSPAEKEWMKTNKVAPFQGPSILDLAA